jgi:hypothetical protein
MSSAALSQSTLVLSRFFARRPCHLQFHRINLHQHSQFVPAVPALHHFSVRDLRHGHSTDNDGFPGGANSQEIAGVAHLRRPTHDYLVPKFEAFVDRYTDIGKRGAKPLVVRQKFLRASQIPACLVNPMRDSAFRKKLRNRFPPPLIPNFFKPTPHQRHILISHKPSSATQLSSRLSSQTLLRSSGNYN